MAALAAAGTAARGGTAVVTLEPCAQPGRGPACADALISAGVTRVVAAIGDPFAAVNGAGFAALQAAGIAVTVGPGAAAAERGMAGFLSRQRRGRPSVTLKLATSLDGRIAAGTGESRWITGERARAHAHLERARHDAILVGAGTYAADAPALDVRLDGLVERSPPRVLLSRTIAPTGWTALTSPPAIAELTDVNELLVEGGAMTAAAFLAADLVDRLLWYRAPILLGAGLAALGDIGLTALDAAHDRWRLTDARALGSDRVEVYERLR